MEVLLDGVQGHVQHSTLLGAQVLLGFLGHVLRGAEDSTFHILVQALHLEIKISINISLLALSRRQGKEKE